MKRIPKFQNGNPFVIGRGINGEYIYSDGTQSATQGSIQRTVAPTRKAANIKISQKQRTAQAKKERQQRIATGQSVMVRGNEIRVKPAAELRSENRDKAIQEKSHQESEQAYQKQRMDKAQAETATALGNFINLFMPSTIARAIYDATTGKEGGFVGSMVEGNEGLGNPVANLAFDIAAPIGMVKAFKYPWNVVNTGMKIGIQGLTQKLSRPKIKSELDWSPEGWFSTRPSYIGYDAKDVAELKSHIPEYLNIERQAKANGTWLKMPDGSTWFGNPRRWVQFMSKDVQKHNPELFWTGIHTTSINPNYTGRLWGVFGKDRLVPARARTYTSNDVFVYPMFSKRSARTRVIDLEGRPWHNTRIDGKKYLDDLIDSEVSKGTQTTKVYNVKDTGDIGGKISPSDTKYYHPDITGKTPQNDIIISENSFRKSLLGNNGSFSHPSNMYKATIPLFSVIKFGKMAGIQ